MNNEKIMGFNHALADIDKQIEELEKQVEELYIKRKEIENKIKQAIKESDKKCEAERTELYQAIKELIDSYNEKYHGNFVLIESFNPYERLHRMGVI